MKKYSFFIALCVAYIATMILYTINYKEPQEGKNLEHVKGDSIIVEHYDTVIVEKPKYLTKTVYKTEVDTFFILTDTTIQQVIVDVPISAYVYGDSTYRCQINGYKVSMEYMKVFPKTVEKTYIYRAKPKKWGIGLQVGYGVSKDGLSPYVGIGGTYNLISF